MKLSISNIVWPSDNDADLYLLMHKYGFEGLEIAPTKVFGQQPYENLDEKRRWQEQLYEKEKLTITSMQSIWYGRQENIFNSKEERSILVEYSKKAIDFAASIKCNNLVFGCPRNRVIPSGGNVKDAVDFFRSLGEYAMEKGTVIGMEANPPIYNTNFINDTKAALDLIDTVDSCGFKLNLDIGTMIQNNEDIQVLKGSEKLINHVHVSEPGLAPIEKRELHKELALFLQNAKYSGFVSIEMGRQEDVGVIEEAMKYIKEIFG